MSFDPAVDPFIHLEALVKDAADRGLVDANAMALATVGSDNQPSVRIVLFKGLVRGGLSFYTNYESRKARELADHPKVSAVFFWPSLARQIRVEGEVHKLYRSESEAYFATRPRLSQLGAWASAQSEEIADHEVLENQVRFFDAKFAGQTVPCPPNWGGYHIVPSAFEFWFGLSGRLHERYCYVRQGDGWRRFMRSP